MKKVQPKTVKDTHNSLKIKNVAEAEGMASFSDENIKEAVVSVKDETESIDYIVEEPITPTTKDKIYDATIPFTSNSSIEEVHSQKETDGNSDISPDEKDYENLVGDSSFVSLSTHEKSDTLKEHQTYPTSSEVYYLHTFLFF